MKKSIYLTIFFILLFAVKANAQSDSVTVAIKIVDDFYAELSALTKDYASAPEFAGLDDAMLKRKETALTAIKPLKWATAPGIRRYRLINTILNDYMIDQSKLVEDAVARLEPYDKERLDALKAKITKIKDAKTAEFEESKKAETYEKERVKPVPPVDVSPYESDTEGGGKGIWFR